MKTKFLKDMILESALHTGKKAKLGEVEFIKSALGDKHLKDLLQKMADFSGKTLEELETYATAKFNKQKSAMTSKVLHETSAKNIAESVIFGMMEDMGFKDKEAPKFNALVFKKLSFMIEAEHPSMFPMKSIISKKAIEPKYIFVPNSKETKYNDVKTAAATNFGLFIYNTDFMQTLIDFAHSKNLKPKGKKYESNGGEIPDVYGYIETLILHEYLHYTMADNYYRKKFKANAKIINYVGDFRSNYALTKAGYSQLPIGLYSDHVNYDRQESYEDMYKLVKEELEKLKQDKDDQKQNGEGGDGESGDSSEGEEGDSHDDHSTEYDDEEVDKEHESDQAKENMDKKHSEGKEGEELSKEDMDKMDKKAKEMDQALQDKKEVQNMDQAKAQRGERGADQENKEGGSVELMDVNSVNWKVLLDKLVKKVMKIEMTTTYSKMHKRNITSATLAIQSGSSVMKPAEVMGDNDRQKLIFVIDSSGSMSQHISLIHSQIMHTIQKNNKGMDDEFYIVKFSNRADVYRCSFKKKNYVKVPITELGDKKVTKLDSAGNKSVLDLLKVEIGGATNFGDILVNNLIKATKNGASVMIFTDADVLYGENAQELKHLLSNSVKTSIGMVFTEMNEYQAFVKEFGKAYGKFVTVLSK